MNRQFYIELLPPAYNGPFARAYHITGARPLWYVLWYSKAVFLHNDGRHLVRLGSSSEDDDRTAPLAITFFVEGKTIKTYKVADLLTAKMPATRKGQNKAVADPKKVREDSKVKSVRSEQANADGVSKKPLNKGSANASGPNQSKSTKDRLWLARINGFKKNCFQLTLVNGKLLEFDITNGSLVAVSNTELPQAKEVKTPTPPTSKNQKHKKKTGAERTPDIVDTGDKSELPGIEPLADGYSLALRARKLAASQQRFGLAMGALLNQKNKANFVFSPLDLFGSLSVIAAAANGTTKEELINVLSIDRQQHKQLLSSLDDYYRVLGVTPLHDRTNEIEFGSSTKGLLVVRKVSGDLALAGIKAGDAILEVNDSIVASKEEFRRHLANAVETVRIKVASAKGSKPREIEIPLPSPLIETAPMLWLHDDIAGAKAFAAKTHEAVDSVRVSLVDMRKPKEAAEKINASMAHSTRGRIRHFLTPTDLSNEPRFICTSHSLVAARWPTPFKIKESQTFHVDNKKNVKVAMIHGQGRYRMLRHANFDVLELHYYGDRLTLLVILPDSTLGLSVIEQGFTGDVFEHMLASLDQQPFRFIEFYLPSFRIGDTSMSLVEPLQTLGARSMFDKGADFSSLIKSKIRLSEIKQRAQIEVNRQGTIAIAATGILGGAIGVRKPDRTVVIDRPFMFFLRDRATDSILFMGKVVDPS